MLERTVRCAQAWGRPGVARRVSRQTFVPECRGHSRLAVLILVFSRDFAIPASGISRFRGQTIGAQCEIELGRLALVLQCAAGTKICVVVESIDRRVKNQLLHVLGM